MLGRAGYSAQLTALSRAALEAALTTLPERQRRLLSRTEIDRAPHKVVALEFGLSLRQFYRARAAAIRAITTTHAGTEMPATELADIHSIRHHLLLTAVVDALGGPNAGPLQVAMAALRGSRSEMDPGIAPSADLLLAIGDAAALRFGDEPARARARLVDVARATKDLRLSRRVTRSIVYGLAAMLTLANEVLATGDPDGALALATEVLASAAELADVHLEIEARACIVNAYLALPCHADEAYARALACVRRCAVASRPRTIVLSLRALAGVLAELGSATEALEACELIDPLVDLLFAGDELAEHRCWRAAIERQSGSAERASALADSALAIRTRRDHVWAATATVAAHARSMLGDYERSTALALDARAQSRRNGWRRVHGESSLVLARNELGRGDLPAAQRWVAEAIPSLDRAAAVNLQRDAYTLSHQLTGNAFHAFLARAYEPPPVRPVSR